MSIDLILCSRPPLCCYAKSKGMLPGINSGGKIKVTDCCKLDFVDNDFHHPNFERHLSVVKRVRPKYATAPDLFTPEQLPQVLEQAAMLSEHAQNVIVIPKYFGAIRNIPEKYMVGLPTISKYALEGGLRCDIYEPEYFGRRVHILGGTPHLQYEIWRSFPQMNVVSIDGNAYMKFANYGEFWNADTCAMDRSLHGKGYRREDLIKMSIDNVVRFWRGKGL